MEIDLQTAKEKLKKIELKLKNSPLSQFDPVIIDPEKMKSQFFPSGLQNWFDLYSSLTFPSCFLNLEKSAAEQIISEHNLFAKHGEFSSELFSFGSPLSLLEEKIQQKINEKSWPKFFIKHSTRSPKDSPILVQKARLAFEKLPNLSAKSLEDLMIIFTSLIRDHYCMRSGKEAIEFLVSSEKVADVCVYALEDSKYNVSDNQIVLREWKCPIPLDAEFRGFVWDGSLNAICPYYHWFFFPELVGKEEKIKSLLSQFFEKEIKPILPSSLKTCQIDFALRNEEVIVIEINPFDGKGLGSFPISTGLFLLDNKQDLKVIQYGPLELRIRKNSLSCQELKFRLESSWKEALKAYF